MVATLNGTGFMFEIRDRFANAFIEYAGQCGCPVLEVGCAYGVATLPALEAGARITASDLDPRHLDILRSKVPPHFLGNLQLKAGALPHIDFPTGHYGAILCSRVLHFLSGEDIDASVRKMARWLAPGGHLYLVADTPYGIWRGKIPEFEAGKAQGERWPGLMIVGKFRFSRLPSTCTTSTGFPTTPSSGCRMTKPERLVRKSLSGVPTVENVNVPSALASIFAWYLRDCSASLQVAS